MLAPDIAVCKLERSRVVWPLIVIHACRQCDRLENEHMCATCVIRMVIAPGSMGVFPLHELASSLILDQHRTSEDGVFWLADSELPLVPA